MGHNDKLTDSPWPGQAADNKLKPKYKTLALTEFNEELGLEDGGV